MTLFWLLITLTAGIAALWMALPFLRHSQAAPQDGAAALSIYRDQAAEVQRDLAAGLISPQDMDAAQMEIEARALKAARLAGPVSAATARSWPIAAAVTALTVTISLATYAATGTPAQGDLPLSARGDEITADKAQAGDLASALTLLQNRLADDPNNLQDWIMLAQGYLSFGDASRAAAAYGNAADLSGRDSEILSAQAETIIIANNDLITAEARRLFQEVLQQTADPRARYYLAKAEAQDKNYAKALEGWAALAADSPADAPWMPLLRQDIVTMARLLETDVTPYLPGATAQEITRAGGIASKAQSATTAEVKARVAILAAALENDPKQFQSWIELARLHRRLGATQKAIAAIESGKSHYAAAPFVLVKLDEAAQSLGLTDKTSLSGPTADDVETITAMTSQDQDNLISDMVAGLANRLQDNPNNPEGWIMLIRSYATLDQPQKARAALDTALAAFQDNPQVLAMLRQQAENLLTLK